MASSVRALGRHLAVFPPPSPRGSHKIRPMKAPIRGPAVATERSLPLPARVLLCAKSGSAPTDLLAGYLDDRRHRPCVMGGAAVDDMSLLPVGSRCRDESRFCLRAGGSRPWPPYVLSARRPANRLMSAQLGTSRACAGNARAGRKPRRSRTPRPRCSGRADVVRSSAVA